MKSILRIAALSLSVALTWQTQAADLSTASMHSIVPFPADGTADILPRILAEKIRPHFSKGVVVENRPGAGGNVGADLVAKANPDGLTLLASPSGPIAINGSLYPSLPYDANELVSITLMAEVPNVIAVGPAIPVETVQEFVAYVRAHPDQVSFASQGNGYTSHLTAMLFQSVTDTRMFHVLYRGTAPAITDPLGGQVGRGFDNLIASMPLHLSGKIRIFAVADKKRSAALPDVPTFAEAGMLAMQAVTWFGVMAPAGAPSATVRKLNTIFVDALKQPEVRASFAERGVQVAGNTPEQMGQFVRDEASRWGKVIRERKITVD